MSHLKNHFAVVGITEKFDKSLLLMKKKLGWSYPVYRKQNVNQKRKKISELSSDLIDLIKEKNKMDIELYDYVPIRCLKMHLEKTGDFSRKS